MDSRGNNGNRQMKSQMKGGNQNMHHKESSSPMYKNESMGVIFDPKQQ